MSLRALPRIVRSAEFRLPVVYSFFFTASAAILGTLFYWTIMSSLERQMTTRIECEVENLKNDFRSEGEHRNSSKRYRGGTNFSPSIISCSISKGIGSRELCLSPDSDGAM